MLINERIVREHITAATAALVSRAAEGRGYGRGGPNWQLPRPIQPVRLFDHLVGAQQDGGWDLDAKCPGGGEIDGQLEPGWLLDRQVGGLGALENLADIRARL